jgi:glucan phosphoethanolaminetransferase (alkaline phosphatase superfamily)
VERQERLLSQRFPHTAMLVSLALFKFRPIAESRLICLLSLSLILAPCFYSATVYGVLGMLIRAIDPNVQYSLLKPSLYLWVSFPPHPSAFAPSSSHCS